MKEENTLLIANHSSGISALRVFCALMVMIYHFEGAKWLLGVDSLFREIPFRRLWPVTFGPFLALSTFLLNLKLYKLKHLSVRDIFIKRLRRIYPIYFLVSLLGIFVLPLFFSFSPYPFPGESKTEISILAILFQPHLIQVFFGEVIFINVFWFLGVQESLYAFIVLLKKKCSSRFKMILRVLLIGLLTLRYFISSLVEIRAESAFFYYFSRLLDIFPIEYGIVSSLFAMHLLESEKKQVRLNSVRLCVLILIVLLLLFTRHESFFLSHLIFSFFISSIIRNLYYFEFKSVLITKLSQLSYSFYAIHSTVIVIVLDYFPFSGLSFALDENLLRYFFILILSLLVSSVLYRFVEKPFSS